ncbi:MAG: VWA domain-containing protein [Phycisphaerales bacterium]|nr:MAG: VWA domain-containing protein [Phycisphaerales bacterium]
MSLPTSVTTARRLPIIAAGLVLAIASAAPAQSVLSSELGAARHVVIPQARSFQVHSEAPGIRIDRVSAKIRILQQTATTTLQIELSNPSRRQQEAVLLLPVPPGAAVSSFLFEGASAEPTARLLPAAEARRLYDAIVAQIRDPALLEFAGYNLIRSSVFPVPPAGTQKLRLTYEHILPADGDRVDYVLPRSESLQYRVPWRISVDITAADPISMVYSPSHDLTTHRVSAKRLKVDLAPHAGNKPGPFRLSYLVEREGMNASILAYPDPSVGISGGGGGGYFLLMIGLPAEADYSDRVIKREVTLVIDRSGSMAGGKMDQVCAAAAQIIEGLRDGEAFNIIDYATNVSSFAPRPVIKNRRTILQAREYLRLVRPTGGTNIHDALLEALRPEPEPGMLPVVLFLTDGLPTVGKTGERAIREMVTRANVHHRRLFTFGVGEDVNVPLLDHLADATRATSTYALPGEDVELKVASVFKRLRGPVFADAELTVQDEQGWPAGLLISRVIPARLPDLFAGDQFIVLGQYRQDGPLTFQLAGNYLGSERSFRFNFDMDAATTGNSFVPRLWASRQIAELIDAIRQAGAARNGGFPPVSFDPFADPRTRELAEEVLRLSMEFGILTEYTAFFAAEGTDLSDWQNLRAVAGDNLSRRAMQTRTGRAAVNQAMNYAAQKGQVTLNYDNSFLDENLQRVEIAQVQQVADRAFFNRGNQWIDARLIAENRNVEPDEVVVFGSDEYREILQTLITEGRQAMLSLSGEIVIRFENRTVLVRNSIEQ